MTKHHLPLEERFWLKVEKQEGDDSCWLWTGARAGGQPYGHMRYDSHNVGAHKISYVLANGEIPAGYFVLHRCRQKNCVRPDHLYLGTQMDVNKQGKERGIEREGLCLSHEQLAVLANRFWTRVEKFEGEGCWLWKGRPQIYFEKWWMSNLQAAYLLTCGPIPKGFIVIRRCEGSHCVRPDHFYLGSRQDLGLKNYHLNGSFQMGQMSRGEQNPHSKLTDAKVIQIKQLLHNRVQVKVIARQFGVHANTIYDIKLGRAWKHIQLEGTMSS